MRSQDRTILEWTKGFNKLYEVPDSRRQPEEFWNATMAHLSCMGEAIRKSNYVELLESASHAFCWMCSYVSKCNNLPSDDIFYFQEDLSSIVGLKFPKLCGHCEANECCCRPAEIDSKPDKSAKYSSLLTQGDDIQFESYTLEKWLSIFDKIYKGQNHMLSLESIGFHLLEEAGEEALAVRQLVQFRGVLNNGIEGINTELFKKISKKRGLVEEFDSAIKQLKIHTKQEKDREALKQVDYTSKEPVFIKARILKAKMDFVIELADTFSWFCATLLKLYAIIKNQNLDEKTIQEFHIEHILKNEYCSTTKSTDLTCHACKKTKCECLFFPESNSHNPS